MILTTHALVGAAIGKNISNPWIVIIISLIAHFFMDTFRHGEYVESFDEKVNFSNTWWKVAFDLFIAGVILIFFVFFEKIDTSTTRNMFIGVFFSMFPDFLTFLYWKYKFKLLSPIYQFHSWVHRYPRFSEQRKWNLRNAINDLIISLTAILFLLI
jgi:hypothetical protein